MKRSQMRKITNIALAVLLSLSFTEASADEKRSASCDAFWQIHHVSGTDYCTFSTPWETKRGNYTVPAGVSGIFGNPKYYGWHLHVDYDGKDDYWHKR